MSGAKRTSSTIGGGATTTKFSLGETVFAYTSEHSWFIGRITHVTANPKYKPLTDAQKNSVVSDSLRKKENSPFLFSVVGQDPLLKIVDVAVHDIEEWNIDVYDESIVSRPVDDLLSLTHLHDGSILRTVAVRYMQDIVYTNIGVIVVALNPFNFKIPHYQDSKMGGYLAEKGQMISDRLLPHSWAQAHNTYFELCSTAKNQSILISGESGAGKTEAAKIVLKYLSSVSVLNGAPEAKDKANLIAANVTACSPLLEAFGNAKTVRNDNSSRFGKLMKLKFDRHTLLLRGAFTTKYLLEKSRIITCGPDERLFHAFYLAYRSPTASNDNLFSDPAETYKSLFAGKCLDNKEFSTSEDYKEVCDALECVGVTGNQLKEVWQIAAGVVHACNVQFVADGEGSKLSLGSELPLQKACALWGVDYETLLAESTTSQVRVAGQVAVKLHPVHKAVDVKDALCKAVYSNLFEWLVEKCNETCDEDSDAMWIALLDIFGFEDFKSGNSFEQLCINFANETLQQHYNWCIFTKDIETCKQEGIDTVDIQFPDLMPTINMIDKIMLQLDDDCSLGCTEKDFLQNITQACHKKDPAFHKDLISQTTFGVHHFAGTVTYTITNWIEKNRDTLKEDLKMLFSGASTTNEVSRDLFPCQARVEKAALELLVSRGGKAPKTVTLGGFFKNQMRDLMAVINSTNPHWIRCVKPHPAKKPLHFDGMYTLSQLEFAGILGTVKIRKAGYPIRFPHLRFCQVFCPILPCNPTKLTPSELRTHASKILDACDFNHKKYAQNGKSIVFIKNDAYHILECHRKSALKSRCLLLQRVGRGYKKRLRAFQITKALIIQRACRGFFHRGEVFDRYLIENRERILAARRRAEEERVAREAALKALQGKIREGISQLTVDLDRVMMGLKAAEEEGWKRLEKRREEVEEKRMWEQLAERIGAMVAVLEREHGSGRQQLMGVEQEAFLQICMDSFDDKLELKTSERGRLLYDEEYQRRQWIEHQFRAWAEKMRGEAKDVERRVELCREKLAYEALLAKSRLERAHKEQTRRMRASSVDRSPIEIEAARLVAGATALNRAVGYTTHATPDGTASTLREAIQRSEPIDVGGWERPTQHSHHLHQSRHNTQIRVPAGVRVYIPQWTSYAVVVKSEIPSSGIQALCVEVLGVSGGILGAGGLMDALTLTNRNLVGGVNDRGSDSIRWVDASEVRIEPPAPQNASQSERERASYSGELNSEKRRYRRLEFEVRCRHFGQQLAEEWDAMYWGDDAQRPPQGDGRDSRRAGDLWNLSTMGPEQHWRDSNIPMADGNKQQHLRSHHEARPEHAPPPRTPPPSIYVSSGQQQKQTSPMYASSQLHLSGGQAGKSLSPNRLESGHSSYMPSSFTSRRQSSAAYSTSNPSATRQAVPQEVDHRSFWERQQQLIEHLEDEMF